MTVNVMEATSNYNDVIFSFTVTVHFMRCNFYLQLSAYKSVSDSWLMFAHSMDVTCSLNRFFGERLAIGSSTDKFHYCSSVVHEPLFDFRTCERCIVYAES
jgi:hypothetical protein